MISFATLAMIGWIPLILVLFSLLKPRKAIITAYMVGWLFLPILRWDLPGLPPYDKATATNLGVLAAILLFDLRRLASFRPKAVDLPMLVFCLSPIGASLSNDLGFYDGAVGAWAMAVTWGVPWVIGRCYFAMLPALRELATGMFVSALVYAPLCLFEMAFGAILHLKVYGYYQHSVEQTVRSDGSVRPMVFMTHGLMLSMWLAACCMAGLAVSRDGGLGRLPRSAATALAVGLVFLTLLTRSVGASVLLFAGIAVWFAARTFRVALPLALMAAAIPGYMALRVTGILDVAHLTGAVSAGMEAFGASPAEAADRLASARARFVAEDHLFERTWSNPVFGVGSWTFNQVVDPETGELLPITIDGYWTLQLSTRGFVGLGAWLALSLLPIWIFVRRHPVRTWRTPQVATGGALLVVLLLHTADCIPNPDVNPIFTLIASGLIGVPALARGRMPVRARVPAGGPVAVPRRDARPPG